MSTSTLVQFILSGVQRLDPHSGSKIMVVGESRALGSWNPHSGLAMSWDYDKYVAEIRVSPKDKVLGAEYKYCIIAENGHVTWSHGSNKAVPVPDKIICLDSQPVVWEEHHHTRHRKKHPQAKHEQEHNNKNSNTDENDANTSKYTSDQQSEMSVSPLVARFNPTDNDSTPSQVIDAVPQWYRNAVIYHIFPLGSPGQKPSQGGFFGSVPDKLDPNMQPVETLLQLQKYYDYFIELGVDVIQFCPVFLSGSHGYDTYDYYKVDPRLGTNETFHTIVQQLHEKGLKVILDGVFNHTGRGFFAFQDLLKNGIHHSQYKDWYYLDANHSNHFGDPFSYKCWSGCSELPLLNLHNSDVREYLFNVAKFWLQQGIDGWRLDCAHEMMPEFWNGFRAACDQTGLDYVLLAETIHGDYNNFVAPNNNLCHSSTNYQIYKPLWSSIKDKNFFELVHNVQREQNMYKGLYLTNFLSNHDITRIASILTDRKELVLAHVLLFTLRGVPAIYYGDEYGMKGRKEDGDAQLRLPMLEPYSRKEKWSSFENQMLVLTKKLVRMRRNFSSCFTNGDASFLCNTNTELVFARAHKTEIAVVTMNVGHRPSQLQIDLSKYGQISQLKKVDLNLTSEDMEPEQEALKGENGKFQCVLSETSAAVWVAVQDK